MSSLLPRLIVLFIAVIIVSIFCFLAKQCSIGGDFYLNLFSFF